jgi:hypothetical protein
MGKLVSSLISLGIILGIIFWINSCSSTGNNITCKKQVSTAGTTGYELCIAGQPNPQYVPYAVYSQARVGGYYDEGTHAAYDSSDDDPHVSHGVFSGDDGDGGGVHVGGDDG